MSSDAAPIHSVLELYLQNFNEMENIKKEIRNFHKQYKNRLEQLKQMQIQNETLILKYLEENELPGIRKGEFIILMNERPIVTRKNSKKEKVENLFQSYQIDTNSDLAKEITSIIINHKSSERQKCIKCKKYSES